MAESSLEALLGRFLEGGEFKDEGVFTLETTRARKALSDFQLPGPHDYLLFLLSAGVAFGARSLRVELGLKGLDIFYDGVSWPEFDLHSLFSALLGPLLESGIPMRELAVGLLGARSAGCQRLEVADKKRKWQLQRDQETDQSGAGEQTQISVQFGLSWVKRAAQHKLSGEPWPEELLIRERFGYCGIPIWWSGQRLNRQPDWEGLFGLGVCRGSCSVEVLPSPLRFEKAWENPATLMVGLVPRGSYPAEALIQGILYPLGLELEYPLLVSVPHLRRDISMSGITDPEGRERLQLAADALFLETLEFFAREKPQEREFLLGHLPRILESEDEELSQRFRQQQPLFELWNGELCSYEPLRQQYEELGFLPYSNRVRPWNEAPLDGELIVRLPREQQESVARLFPTLRSSEDLLHKAQLASERRQRFLARPEELQSLGADYVVLKREWGEVGFKEGETPRICYHFKSRLADEQAADLPPGVVVVLDSSEPILSKEWTGVDESSPILKELLGEVKESLAELFLTVEGRAGRVSFLDWCYRQQTAPGPLAEVKLFASLDGATYSFAEVADIRERLGYLPVIRDDFPVETLPGQAVFREGILPDDIWAPWRYLDSELSQFQVREKRLAAWEAVEPSEPFLDGDYEQRVELGQGIQLGVLGYGNETSFLFFWTRGRPLGSEPAPVSLIPDGYHLLLDGAEFEPDRYCERPQDGAYKDHMVELAGEVLKDWALLQSPEVQRHHLKHMLREGGNLEAAWLELPILLDGEGGSHSVGALPESVLYCHPNDEVQNGKALILEPELVGLLQDYFPTYSFERARTRASESERLLPLKPVTATDFPSGWAQLLGVFEQSRIYTLTGFQEFDSSVPYEAVVNQEGVSLEEARALAEGWSSCLFEARLKQPEAWREYFVDLVRRRGELDVLQPVLELPLFLDQRGRLWSYRELLPLEQLVHVPPDAQAWPDLWSWTQRQESPVFVLGHPERTLLESRWELLEADPEADEEEQARRDMEPLFERARSLPSPKSSSFAAVRRELLEAARRLPELELVVRDLPLFPTFEGDWLSLQQLRQRGTVGLRLDGVRPLLRLWDLEVAEVSERRPVTAEPAAEDFEARVARLWKEMSPRKLVLRFVQGDMFAEEVAGALRVGRRHALVRRLKKHPDGVYLMCGALIRFCDDKGRRVFLKRLVKTLEM